MKLKRIKAGAYRTNDDDWLIRNVSVRGHRNRWVIIGPRHTDATGGPDIDRFHDTLNAARVELARYYNPAEWRKARKPEFEPADHGVASLGQNELWKTQDGETLKLAEMKPSHRRNTILFLVRRAGHLEMQASTRMLAGPGPGGDMACDRFERELDDMHRDPVGWLLDTPLLRMLIWLQEWEVAMPEDVAATINAERERQRDGGWLRPVAAAEDALEHRTGDDG